MIEEKNPAQTPAQDLTQNQVENPTPAQTQPAPAAAPAKPTLPLPDCTDRDCRFAALLFVLCLFAANCTALCRTGIGYALSTLLLAGASLVYLRRELRWNALNVLCLAACVLVTASSAVFGETAMTPYKMLFAWLSGALFLVSATGAGASMLDDFRAAFERLCRSSAAPLPELLAQTVTPGGVLVVISGLDYESLRLTPRSQIRRL